MDRLEQFTTTGADDLLARAQLIVGMYDRHGILPDAFDMARLRESVAVASAESWERRKLALIASTSRAA